MNKKLVGLGILAMTAVASVAHASEGDVMDNVFDLIGAIKSGDHRLAAAFGLIIVMMVLNKVRDRVSFFKGDRGGALLVMFLSLAGNFVSTLRSDAPLDLQNILSAVAVAFTAAGGYSWIKKVIWPKDDEPQS